MSLAATIAAMSAAPASTRIMRLSKVPLPFPSVVFIVIVFLLS
jgi:hypothetical protein